MLKQSVRGVVLFLYLITCVVSVSAQSRHRFTVHVPFQFVLNGQTLTAGEYVIERTDPAKPNIVTLQRADGGIVRVIITQRVERDNPSTESSLIFNSCGVPWAALKASGIQNSGRKAAATIHKAKTGGSIKAQV